MGVPAGGTAARVRGGRGDRGEGATRIETGRSVVVRVPSWGRCRRVDGAAFPPGLPPIRGPNRATGRRRRLVGEAGFEPAKAEPSDLQSDPFDRSGIPPPGESEPEGSRRRGRRRTAGCGCANDRRDDRYDRMPCPRDARPGGAAWPGTARSRVILESVYVLSERPRPRTARGDRVPPELVGPVAGLEPATC